MRDPAGIPISESEGFLLEIWDPRDPVSVEPRDIKKIKKYRYQLYSKVLYHGYAIHQ